VPFALKTPVDTMSDTGMKTREGTPEDHSGRAKPSKGTAARSRKARFVGYLREEGGRREYAASATSDLRVEKA